MAQSVKVGPSLPADLQVTRINTDKPESAQQQPAPRVAPVGENVTDRGDGTYVVRNTDILGNIIETIMGTVTPHVETVAELKARVKHSYQDANGNTVETY